MSAQNSNISASLAIKNTAWLYGEKLLSMVALLVVNIAMARQLGPSDFGVLQMLTSFVALFAPFVALGLNGIVTRELVEHKQQEGEIVSTVMLLRFLGVIAGSLTMLLLCAFMIEALQPHFWLLCILLIGNSFTTFNVLEHWFQSRMEAKYVASIRTLVLYSFSIIKIFVAIYAPSTMYFVIIFASEWFIGCSMLALVYFYRRKGTHSFKINLAYGWNLLKESIWLILSGVAAVIYLKIDVLMLGSMVSEKEVGIYAVAVKFSEIWYFFPTALAAAFFPKILQERKNCYSTYESTLQILLDGLFIFALFVIFFTLVLSPLFIPMLYGGEYVRSVGLLNIQIWACCFVFLRAITSKWLLAESLVKFSLLSQGAGALSNVALNLVFIPKWQAEGAAWATLISYFVASYVCFWLFPETRFIALKMTKVLTFPSRAKLYYLRIKSNFPD